MAIKDTNIKYRKCKFDFQKNMIVEYLKDEIVEHPISEIFKDYSVEQNERFFDFTIKETQEIRPSEDVFSGE